MRAKVLSRPVLLSIAGLALTLGGPFVYGALLFDARMRASGAPAWPLMVLGLLLGGLAVRADARRRFKVALAAEVLFLALFAYGFFQLSSLPPAAEAARIESAIDFTLPDQDGKPVTLSERWVKGPQLLLFYRGSW